MTGIKFMNGITQTFMNSITQTDTAIKMNKHQVEKIDAMKASRLKESPKCLKVMKNMHYVQQRHVH